MTILLTLTFEISCEDDLEYLSYNDDNEIEELPVSEADNKQFKRDCEEALKKTLLMIANSNEIEEMITESEAWQITFDQNLSDVVQKYYDEETDIQNIVDNLLVGFSIQKQEIN